MHPCEGHLQLKHADKCSDWQWFYGNGVSRMQWFYDWQFNIPEGPGVGAWLSFKSLSHHTLSACGDIRLDSLKMMFVLTILKENQSAGCRPTNRPALVRLAVPSVVIDTFLRRPDFELDFWFSVAATGFPILPLSSPNLGSLPQTGIST